MKMLVNSQFIYVFIIIGFFGIFSCNDKIVNKDIDRINIWGEYKDISKTDIGICNDSFIKSKILIDTIYKDNGNIINTLNYNELFNNYCGITTSINKYSFYNDWLIEFMGNRKVFHNGTELNEYIYNFKKMNSTNESKYTFHFTKELLIYKFFYSIRTFYKLDTIKYYKNNNLINTKVLSDIQLISDSFKIIGNNKQ